LLLGPDFMTDIVIVETGDHARLSLKLSYNWHFEINKSKAEDAAAIFSVPDFVGDACKAIASRVRGAVASVSFDNFHRNSAKVIRSAVFGVDKDGSVKNKLIFSSNSLVITNIDIQSVEPVDQRTRDSLQKSVQLAIEITTNSQEAASRHEAQRLEQEAKGRLERQKILDESEAEKARTNLLLLQAQSSEVESKGQATADAKARAMASQIVGQASVTQAELKSKAATTKTEAELEQIKNRQEAEIVHQQQLNKLEVERAKAFANIESEKFKKTIATIGPQTIKAIALAGPELQARLLKGLGLQSVLLTDGSSPVNLLNVAGGLLGSNK